MKAINTKYISNEELKIFIIKNKILNEKQVFLQIFTGICEVKYIQKLVSFIKDIVPNIAILGTTTSGEIMNGSSYSKSTVLSFSLFENTEIKTYFTDVIEDSFETAQNLIAKFDKNKLAKLAISFADGLGVNGEEFLNAFSEYNKELIVSGGLSGDNAVFSKTIVFTEDYISTSGAIVALFYNDNLKVSTNASFGWEHIGKTMTVTKAEKNVVYEIDNQNIVEIYGKYLGENVARNLPSIGIEFPLIVRDKECSKTRAVLGKNDDGSLTFAGNLSVGDKVTFGYGNVQSILNYGDNVYRAQDIQKSEAIFIYSCMARLYLLQDNINIELVPLQNINNTSGFFTYGEFYSNSKNSKNELLNQTMTVLGISEDTQLFASEDKYCKVDFIDKKNNNLTLKALSHLISQTTQELEDMNLNLKDRIKEEVDKNREKDQQMLQQSKLAQMGEMISMIAHQWRQPLSAISATSGSISLKSELGTLDDETAKELADRITDYSQHLSSTIEDFRNFFKENKTKEDTNLKIIVQETLDIVKVSLDSSGIELIVEVTSSKKINTYKNEIKQVVLNILKNAEDALKEKLIKHPKIVIIVGDTNLIIKDNAGGVPEEIIGKIFEPYFSTKNKKDGTGLGLYMSKTIIEEHCGGSLSVANGERGAIFKVEVGT